MAGAPVDAVSALDLEEDITEEDYSTAEKESLNTNSACSISFTGTLSNQGNGKKKARASDGIASGLNSMADAFCTRPYCQEDWLCTRPCGC